MTRAILAAVDGIRHGLDAVDEIGRLRSPPRRSRRRPRLVERGIERERAEGLTPTASLVDLRDAIPRSAFFRAGKVDA